VCEESLELERLYGTKKDEWLRRPGCKISLDCWELATLVVTFSSYHRQRSIRAVLMKDGCEEVVKITLGF
jgi:hypothetical protein